MSLVFEQYVFIAFAFPLLQVKFYQPKKLILLKQSKFLEQRI